MDVEDLKTQITVHAFTRISERLKIMTENGDITEDEAEHIEKNLNEVLNHEFNCESSYGVMLGRFEINNASDLVTEKHKSGVYYEINSLDHYDIVKDSTGNEFWGIIRGNRLITAFLRKTIQRQTANQPRDCGGLGVENIVDNVVSWILKN